MPYKNNSTIMGHVGRDAEFRWNGDMCFADFSVADKRNASFFQDVQSSLDDILVQFHVRDTVHQQTTRTVASFEDSDRMAD